MINADVNVRISPEPGIGQPANAMAITTAIWPALNRRFPKNGLINATNTMKTPYTDTGMLLPTRYVCFRMRSLKKLAAHTEMAPSKPNNTAQKLIIASFVLW